MSPRRWSALSGAWKGRRWILLLTSLAIGALMLFDHPGLRAEHFALTLPWDGRPVHTTIGEPRLSAASEAVLVTDVVFSIRWRGWLHVRDAGRHRFAVDADDGAYLRIGGQLVADSAGVFGDHRPSGRLELAPGLHPIEIGLHQTTGESRLAIDWKRPKRAGGAGAGETAIEAGGGLPARDLYAAKPLAPRRVLRRIFAGWPRVYVQPSVSASWSAPSGSRAAPYRSRRRVIASSGAGMPGTASACAPAF